MALLGKKMFRKINKIGHKAMHVARGGLKYGGMFAQGMGAVTGNPALIGAGVAASRLASIERK